VWGLLQKLPYILFPSLALQGQKLMLGTVWIPLRVPEVNTGPLGLLRRLEDPETAMAGVGVSKFTICPFMALSTSSLAGPGIHPRHLSRVAA
jgi:hypothetical protein